jgi:hypothetical protein
MTELERALRALPVEWPATPDVVSRLDLARRRHRVLGAAVAVAFAVGAAFAVPDSRGAILRFFHLRGVTVEHVGTLPPIEERALTDGLGKPIGDAAARSRLGAPFLPAGHGPLFDQNGFISTLLEIPEPALLTEFGSASLIKKFATGNIEWVPVAPGVVGLWVPGHHVVFFAGTSPRLAGNVLLWVSRNVTFRLEAPGLTKARAFELAREILGTG